jgi:hypothetical protein
VGLTFFDELLSVTKLNRPRFSCGQEQGLIRCQSDTAVDGRADPPTVYFMSALPAISICVLKAKWACLLSPDACARSSALHQRCRLEAAPTNEGGFVQQCWCAALLQLHDASTTLWCMAAANSRQSLISSAQTCNLTLQPAQVLGIQRAVINTHEKSVVLSQRRKEIYQ